MLCDDSLLLPAILLLHHSNAPFLFVCSPIFLFWSDDRQGGGEGAERVVREFDGTIGGAVGQAMGQAVEWSESWTVEHAIACQTIVRST